MDIKEASLKHSGTFEEVSSSSFSALSAELNGSIWQKVKESRNIFKLLQFESKFGDTKKFNSKMSPLLRGSPQDNCIAKHLYVENQLCLTSSRHVVKNTPLSETSR